MLTQETLDTLKNRVGYGQTLEESFPFALGNGLTIGESGLTVPFFHALATVENLHASLPQVFETDGEKSAFEALLEDLRVQSVVRAVNDVLECSIDYNPELSYDDLVVANIALFDNVIGYRLAITILEKCMTTTRTNIVERNAKLSVSNLKLEINGYRNEAGILVADGLGIMLHKSIKKAVRKLFPIKHVIKSVQAW